MSFTDLLNLKQSYNFIWRSTWAGTKQWNVIVVSIISSFYTNEGSQSLNPSINGGETNEKKHFNAFESSTHVYKIHPSVQKMSSLNSDVYRKGLKEKPSSHGDAK